GHARLDPEIDALPVHEQRDQHVARTERRGACLCSRVARASGGDGGGEPAHAGAPQEVTAADTESVVFVRHVRNNTSHGVTSGIGMCARSRWYPALWRHHMQARRDFLRQVIPAGAVGLVGFKTEWLEVVVRDRE